MKREERSHAHPREKRLTCQWYFCDFWYTNENFKINVYLKLHRLKTKEYTYNYRGFFFVTNWSGRHRNGPSGRMNLRLPSGTKKLYLWHSHATTITTNTRIPTSCPHAKRNFQVLGCQFLRNQKKKIQPN